MNKIRKGYLTKNLTNGVSIEVTVSADQIKHWVSFMENETDIRDTINILEGRLAQINSVKNALKCPVVEKTEYEKITEYYAEKGRNRGD